MTEDAALRAAIAAEPDEDAPRLAYADWLDEHRPDRRPSPAAGASARAEFIRVQCRLAAGGYQDPNYAALLDREADLAAWLNRHDPDPDADILGDLRDIASFDDGISGYGEWDLYHRGFPEVLDLSCCLQDEPEVSVASVEAKLLETFAQSPSRSLRLDDANTEEITGLTRRPVFRQLRGLHLDGVEDNLWEEAFEAIAATRNSRGLRRLLIDRLLDDRVCDALARSPHLANLESFSVTWPVQARAIKALGRSKWFRRLRRLNLLLWHDSGLRALADLPPMTRLESLTLNDPEVTSAAAVKRFAASDAFPALAHLSLNRARLSADHVLHLANGRWPLRHLRLEGNDVRKAGVEALVAAPFASTLQVLELPACQITASGVRTLGGADTLAGLRHLSLADNPIGPGGLEAIAASKTLRRLRGLNIGDTDTPRGRLAARYASRFLNRLDMPDLRHLDLNSVPVGVRGAEALATSPTFANLSRLGLRNCNLGEEGVRRLIGSRYLSNLVVLDMAGNRTARGVGRLANPKVLPKLANCRLGHGVSKATSTRLRKRPGILI